METIRKQADKLLGTLCVAMMAIMTLTVTYQVFVRYFLGKPSAFSEVMTRYLFIWMSLLGASYVFGLREHMNMSFIRDRFPEKIRLFLECVCEIGIAVFTLFAMLIGGYFGTLKQMSQMDSALHIPMGIIYAVIPISAVFTIFYCISNVCRLTRKSYASLKEEKGE